MQEILSLSDHEASALHTSNTESLDGLPFSQFVHGLDTSDISSINPKLLTLTPLDSSSLGLERTCPPFTPEFSLHQILKEP